MMVFQARFESGDVMMDSNKLYFLVAIRVDVLNQGFVSGSNKIGFLSRYDAGETCQYSKFHLSQDNRFIGYYNRR